MNPRTPIIVGVGCITDRGLVPRTERSRYDLLAESAELALVDTQSAAFRDCIDTLVVIRSHADTSPRFSHGFGSSTNPPKSVANRLNITPKRNIYTWYSGNMPQYAANWASEKIVAGEMAAVLITGGEVLKTQLYAQRESLPLDWNEDPGGESELLGDSRTAWTQHEYNHGLRSAISIYPLFENDIRRERGSSISEHMDAMAKLMSGLSKVAAKNENAVRQQYFSPEQLATINDENRWISFPYPRLMMSNAFIDQAGSFILTSVENAQKHGIPREQWVFLHGYADANDHWFVTEKADLCSSPAVRLASRSALEMAGRSIDDIDHFDLYSCFPSAVEITCKELGILEDDPRGLTVTGGLPYYGGPGNSYVVMSICEMMKTLREDVGSFGLVTANGNWISKHSFGVYSTTPITGDWVGNDCRSLQDEIDSMPKADFTESPEGAARVVTYGINFDRHNPKSATVIGEELKSGKRFIAVLDPGSIIDSEKVDWLGAQGAVRKVEGVNVFTPA